MDNEIVSNRQRKISRNYISRMANLIQLQRFSEAADTGLYFASILRMWSVQEANLQKAAVKGLARAK